MFPLSIYISFGFGVATQLLIGEYRADPTIKYKNTWSFITAVSIAVVAWPALIAIQTHDLAKGAREER